MCPAVAPARRALITNDPTVPLLSPSSLSPSFNPGIFKLLVLLFVGSVSLNPQVSAHLFSLLF